MKEKSQGAFEGCNLQQSSLSTESSRVNAGFPSPPPKPKRWNHNISGDYANVSTISCGRNDTGVKEVIPCRPNSTYASKSQSMNDFTELKQLLNQTKDCEYAETSDSSFLENNLIKGASYMALLNVRIPKIKQLPLGLKKY